jgi:hypothetical protein
VRVLDNGTESKLVWSVPTSKAHVERVVGEDGSVHFAVVPKELGATQVELEFALQDGGAAAIRRTFQVKSDLSHVARVTVSGGSAELVQIRWRARTGPFTSFELTPDMEMSSGESREVVLPATVTDVSVLGPSFYRIDNNPFKSPGIYTRLSPVSAGTIVDYSIIVE